MRLSFEYREFHGADPEKFFKDTMRKNVRDRNILFEFESELINFIQNENCQVKEFPGMCSYYRMLLHRVSAYFGLEHNVIAGGTSLAEIPKPEMKATKSIEEREQSYVLARARIFSKTFENVSFLFLLCRFCAKPWSSAENNPETCMIYNQQKCLAQQYGFGNNGGGGTGRNLPIPQVEAASPYAHPPYRLNEIMEMPNVPQFGRMFNPLSVFPGSPVMCLVQSIDQVPEGALLINPHTGEPLLNTDGSLCFHNSRTMLRMQQQMNTFAATSNVHPHPTMGSISPGDQMTAAATMLPNNLQSLNINVDHPPTINTYTNEPPMAAQFNAGMNQSGMRVTAAESANSNEELMLNRYGDAETTYAAQVMHPMNNFQGNVFDQYRRGSQDDRQNE
ncbi:hypothetical protein D917_01503 [Trichinella nativa]|uniref:R3H domain-containing protein n=1 Tax=Trichinella nativa TaxID=6335 RepID=A0A1Y3EQS6_9BILA|nr:hypothetical protein D917_01503 [Trichinella nativa]